MGVQLAQLFFSVFVICSLELVSGDRAVIYVSPYDKVSRTGVRIVYRSRDPDGYASFKDRYLTFNASADADRVLRISVHFHKLQWDYQGEYYYYEQTNGRLFPGDVIRYSVTPDGNGKLVSYRMPWVVNYCALDYRKTNEFKCSSALREQFSASLVYKTMSDVTTTRGYAQTSTEGQSTIPVVGIVMPVVIGCLLVLLFAIGISSKFRKKKNFQRRRHARSSLRTREQPPTVQTSSTLGIFTVISEEISRTVANNDPPPSYHAAIEVEAFDYKAYGSHSITIGEEEPTCRTEDAKPEEESELPPLYEQLCLKCYVAKSSPLCTHNSSTFVSPDSS